MLLIVLLCLLIGVWLWLCLLPLLPSLAGPAAAAGSCHRLCYRAQRRSAAAQAGAGRCVPVLSSILSSLLPMPLLLAVSAVPGVHRAQRRQQPQAGGAGASAAPAFRGAPLPALLHQLFLLPIFLPSIGVGWQCRQRVCKYCEAPFHTAVPLTCLQGDDEGGANNGNVADCEAEGAPREASGRVIVFTNFREGVMSICEALRAHEPLITAKSVCQLAPGRHRTATRSGRGHCLLNRLLQCSAARLEGASSACCRAFVGQGAGGKGSGSGMSQKEQKEVLAGFR